MKTSSQQVLNEADIGARIMRGEEVKIEPQRPPLTEDTGDVTAYANPSEFFKFTTNPAGNYEWKLAEDALRDAVESSAVQSAFKKAIVAELKKNRNVSGMLK